MSVRVFAPAKINLTLEVGRPRADGYHPLQSAVVFAGEGDWIKAAPADELTLTITGPFAAGLKADETNLVLRAARLLDPRRGAALTLEKYLPIASGIGGGSSDAAATLIALNQHWSLGHSTIDLARMAGPLGADVPVCVYKQSAWITGAGADISALTAPILNAILVNPGAPLATPSVYRCFDDLGLGAAFADRSAPDWTTPASVVASIRELGNDLEAAAVALMPDLAGLLRTLRADRRALCAGLSGSGATCFALTQTGEDARAMAAEMATHSRDWWVRPTVLGGA